MTNTPDRKQAVPALIGDITNKLVITGLAGPAQDMAAHTDNADNCFILGGAMGAAVSMGLGLALSKPNKPVLVVTGDGELLMNVGSLSVVGAMQPANLSIVCVDNSHYGETGFQPSHTAMGVDLEEIARGSGIATTATVHSMSDIEAARKLLNDAKGPVFVLLKVSKEPSARHPRSWDAVERKNAFIRVLDD
ncbi:MAG: thiamine pyrophosphate-dependent enzyme [Hyphomicrobiaceae bacterium]